jgi:hypothetical protein
MVELISRFMECTIIYMNSEGLWQRRNINFALDIAPEMKIKGCEVW